METEFKREEAETCFRCHSNPPMFRLISLVKLPTEGGPLQPDCLVELLCTSCLRLEMDDLYEGFVQSNIPVGVDESPDVCVSRQIGVAVVPLVFSERESQLLIEGLRTGGIEKALEFDM